MLGEVLTDEQLEVTRCGWAVARVHPRRPPAEERRRQLCEFLPRLPQPVDDQHPGSFQHGSTPNRSSSRLANSIVTPSAKTTSFGPARAQLGKTPSRAAPHQAIYARHRDRAIANAYPVNATAFSVTGATLDPRFESYLLL